MISPGQGWRDRGKKLSPVFVHRLRKVREMLPHKSFSPSMRQLQLGRAAFAPLLSVYLLLTSSIYWCALALAVLVPVQAPCPLQHPAGRRHREPKKGWSWVLGTRTMVKCRDQAQLTKRCPGAQRAAELHVGCPGTSAGTEEPWACVTCVGSFTPTLQAWRVGRRHSWQRADAFPFLAVPHCPKNPRHRPQAEWGCALWERDGTHSSGCCFPPSWLILHPRAQVQLLAWGRSPTPHCIASETGVMPGGRAGLGGGGDSCITAGKAKTQHLFGFASLMNGTSWCRGQTFRQHKWEGYKAPLHPVGVFSPAFTGFPE